MALTFPRTGFQTLVSSQGFSMLPEFRREVSRSVGGETRVAGYNTPLWRGQMQTIPMRYGEAMQVRAFLLSTGDGLQTFRLYDPRHKYPASDPAGATVGDSVAIKGVTDGAISFKGLPAGFVLTVGDYFAFDYGTPARRALHQLLEGATADGLGETSELACVPPIRQGAAADDAVDFKRPEGTFMLVPGTLSEGGQIPTMQFSFEFAQVV